MNCRFERYDQLDGDDRRLADLLHSGSDERAMLGANGVNKYCGAPYPRTVVAFGSCTASTISERGWFAARAAWQNLARQAAEDGVLGAADAAGRRIRRKLAHLMEVDDLPGLEVVLTPSGSDAESVALYLASLRDERPLVNIVVGAREVGSGTVLAAGGRYFSECVPSGAKREPGAPLDAALAERTSVVQVRIRNDLAAERSPDELDAEIQDLVAGAVASGARVIVHVVAHSKTGVHAPRLETVNALVARYGERVVALIDAAQGRFSRRGLRDYLARGCMVIMTGSKFYGGPPFSGCLLVPHSVLPCGGKEMRFPAGFSDYLTPAQLPESWSAARASLNQTANIGLLLRWAAAIAEIAAYYDAPGPSRYRVLRYFEAQTPIILGRSPLLELINVPIPVYDDMSERLLESKTTVFSFRVKARSGRQLDQATLMCWVRWMNQDISAAAAAETPDNIVLAARTCFQLGQAVHVGEQQSGEHDHVIRVAIGGELITSVATDLALGASLDQRLAWLANKLEQLRMKIEFIAGHSAALAAA
ncbi:MAG: hypothetical protein JNJ60_12155 [Rhodocyclaceae bacterium]|nr:hypothetical protein [Rhodocyclaceae bacterium]